MVQVLEMDARGQLLPIFSVKLDKTVPKGVAFADNANDVYVFGLFEGDVYVPRVFDNHKFPYLLSRMKGICSKAAMGRCYQHRTLAHQCKCITQSFDEMCLCKGSGDVAIDLQCNQFVVDNGTNGFTLLRLQNTCYIRNFPTGIPTKRLPKQVTFGEGCKVVVGGSDHGAVYVFDIGTGLVLDILSHPGRGLVQTVTVCVLCRCPNAITK